MKLKSLVKSVAPVVGAAVGGYFGGTAGAGAGYSLLGGSSSGSSNGGILGSLVQGAVGLGTDYLDGQLQLQQQKELLNWQHDKNLAMADKNLQVNQALQNQAFEQNQTLAQQDYQRNLEMWNYENEYNSPVNQMARLRAAGLNPNLVYGGGNVSGLTTSGAPQMSSATAQAAEYQAPMMGRPETPKERTFNRIMDAMSRYQQVENQQLTNEYTRRKIELAERDADRSDRLADAQIENMSALYGLRGAELDLAVRKQNEYESKPQSLLGRNLHDLINYTRRGWRYVKKGTGGETAELF